MLNNNLRYLLLHLSTKPMEIVTILLSLGLAQFTHLLLRTNVTEIFKQYFSHNENVVIQCVQPKHNTTISPFLAQEQQANVVLHSAAAATTANTATIR